MHTVCPTLRTYVESDILPRYDHFDQAHQRPHAEMVIRQSLQLAEDLGADLNMAYAIAAYHDLGLCEGRELHHQASARILRADDKLRQWFTAEQIDLMADAAEDHRASATRPPRSLYGRIVAEADRYIDPADIICRTIQFGLDHYPTLSTEEHYQRTLQHLREKYGRQGYLRLWFPQSPNVGRLESLRQIIDNEPQLRQIFEQVWNELTNR